MKERNKISDEDAWTPGYTPVEERDYIDTGGGALKDIIGNTLWEFAKGDRDYFLIGDMIGQKTITTSWAQDASDTTRIEYETPYFKALAGEEDSLPDYNFGLIKEAEIELGRHLFRLDPIKQGDYDVFDYDGTNFYISESPKGETFQKAINKFYTISVLGHFDKSEITHYPYAGMHIGTKLQNNPDSGELSLKFEEPVLGDLYVNKDGEFYDYWNIGLDKNENLLLDYINPSKLGSMPSYRLTNLKRWAASKFTTPPKVYGRAEIDLDEVATFLQELYEKDQIGYYRLEEQIVKKDLSPVNFAEYLQGYMSRVLGDKGGR